jgi:hypothetical protein
VLSKDQVVKDSDHVVLIMLVVGIQEF